VIRVTLVLLAAGLVAGVALAETEAASWGIGISPADPADEASLGTGVDVSAVLINERTGEPAAVVDRAETIRLMATLKASPDGPDRPLRLTCEVEFIAVDGTRADGTDGVCFAGTLRAAAARPQKLNLTFRFTPSRDDMAGTAGIKLHLWDDRTGDEAILVPTYDWKGGR
jgi:hypothetical protein